MNTTIKAGAVAVASAAMLISPVLAANEGQIEGGNIYRIQNITQKVDYANPANAKACDLLEYRVRIHNPGPGNLEQVNVKASLPSGSATSNTSTITISSENADPQSTTATAVVNFADSENLSYVPGTTQLLDANTNVISNLPDGVTQGGVNIGEVGVSINNKRFVQFEAKVNCPTPVTPSVTPPATPSTPAALPQTGADELAALAGVGGTGAIGYGVMAYRRSKKALADKLLNRK